MLVVMCSLVQVSTVAVMCASACVVDGQVQYFSGTFVFFLIVRLASLYLLNKNAVIALLDFVLL